MPTRKLWLNMTEQTRGRNRHGDGKGTSLGRRSPWWRRLARTPWYWLSRPYCQWQLRRLERQGRAPITVLFYHRVADSPVVPWTVSTRAFQRHLDWLQRHAELISLAEALRRLAAGENRRRAVVITFDDGYAENCDFALPLLLDRGVPFTYFVTLEPVVRQKPFAHDLALGVALPPNSVQQLRQLAAAGVDIGSHTRTHADLGRIEDPDRLHDEVVQATRELEDLIGSPVRHFAFPFGQWSNLNPQAFLLARQAGLRCVCSAYGGYNLPGEDAFHVQRFAADEPLSRLRLVAGYDPRLQRRFARYPYPKPLPQEEQTSDPLAPAGT